MTRRSVIVWSACGLALTGGAALALGLTIGGSGHTVPPAAVPSETGAVVATTTSTVPPPPPMTTMETTGETSALATSATAAPTRGSYPKSHAAAAPTDASQDRGSRDEMIRQRVYQSPINARPTGNPNAGSPWPPTSVATPTPLPPRTTQPTYTPSTQPGS